MPDNNRTLIDRILFIVEFSIWYVRRIVTLEDVRNAKSFDELSDSGVLRFGLLSYKGQRWYHQLIIFFLGVTIWIGTYAGIMYWFGWAEYATLDTTEAVTYRRHAATGALMVSVAFYSISFVRAYGGPVTNAGIFPIITVSLMPSEVASLFSGGIENRFTEASLTTSPSQFSVDVLSVYFFGYSPFVLALIIMGLFWKYGGARGHSHKLNFHRRMPDIYFRDGPDEEWDSLHEDIQQLYLKAGYVPEEDCQDASGSGDNPLSEDSKERPEH